MVLADVLRLRSNRLRQDSADISGAVAGARLDAVERDSRAFEGLVQEVVAVAAGFGGVAGIVQLDRAFDGEVGTA